MPSGFHACFYSRLVRLDANKAKVRDIHVMGRQCYTSSGRALCIASFPNVTFGEISNSSGTLSLSSLFNELYCQPWNRWLQSRVRAFNENIWYHFLP
jgi:hypothetical protein